MIQTGIVIEKNGSSATVEICRSNTCATCAAGKDGNCGFCALAEKAGTIRMEAENACDADVGDEVQVKTSENVFLGISALLFLLPIVTALLVYLFAVSLGAQELLAVSAALAAMAVVLAAVIFLFKFIPPKKRLVQICSVIPREQPKI